MLDENLPAFFLKPSSSDIKHHRDIYLSHHGSEPAPAYSLQNVDPASLTLAHKNCYGAAIFDAYNPDVLFGEVLARPGWTQPTLSAEELRKHGGVPPPPQPMLPHEFVVQLYNPDQQVRIEVKEGKWGASDTYEFSMPQATFRTPSASNLDRGQSDPASLAITPKIQFVWRKESKLSKDLTCFMTGKTSDKETKKKSKRDPDIAIALWRSMRELTIYETNIQRLEIEDPKGLEVVLLLGAVILKDLYFAANREGALMRELFNISNAPNERKLSSGGRKLSNPNRTTNAVSIVGNPALSHHPPPRTHPVGGAGYGGMPPPAPSSLNARSDEKRGELPKLQTTPPGQGVAMRPPPPRSNQQPPPVADARSQWELDAETARLKAQAEAEAKAAAKRRKEREKADEAERKRLQRMVEEEEKAARKKQAEIEKETERLRRLYGIQAPVPERPNTSRPAAQQGSRPSRQHQPFMQPIPQGRPSPPTQHHQQQATRPAPPRGSNGLYLQPSASASVMMMSGANGAASSSSLNVSGKPTKKKSSFFGLRSGGGGGGSNNNGDNPDDHGGGSGTDSRLRKKGSAMW